MTVVIKVGRRVPRSWFRAGIQKAQGILSFQEHLFSIIKQSFNLAKRKANTSNTGVKFVVTNDIEVEDLNYQLEWVVVTIQGTEAQEKEEFEEAQAMYKPFGKLMKKEMPVDDNMKKFFKTKKLSAFQLDEAYKKGYGDLTSNNIANKLLEMGVVTHIEWVKDYDSRGYLG